MPVGVLLQKNGLARRGGKNDPCNSSNAAYVRFGDRAGRVSL